MSKHNQPLTKTIWQPLNQQSQILATLAALATLALQVHTLLDNQIALPQIIFNNSGLRPSETIEGEFISFQEN